MTYPFDHIARRAAMWLFLAVVAPAGFGCQCQMSAGPASQAYADEHSAGPGDDVQCDDPTEATVNETEQAQRRQAARRRANQFVELVEYEPASLAPAKALAILSYPAEDGPLGKRSFVYDDALALLWFAWTGQDRVAEGLAETLMFLQNPDGSWGFSFDTENTDAYHASYVRSGTVAWAAHALGYYGQRFGKPRAVRAARRGATFLRTMRLGGDRLNRGLVSAGYGVPSTPADAPSAAPLPYAVAEHQFDAHAVLARYQPKSAERLAGRMLEELWIEDEGRFAVSVSADRVNARRALDAAGAWGALWLLSTGDRPRARRSYEYTLEHFPAAEDGSLYGFRPYEDPIDGYDPEQSDEHIFVEGSMSMGLLAHRLGDEQVAQRVLATGVALSCRGEPGLAYSNVEVAGFSTRPAAASTLWFLFLEREMSGGRQAPLFESTVRDTTG